MTCPDEHIRLAVLAHIENVRSVAPREIAIALAQEDTQWQRLLPQIRAVAIDLNKQGKLDFVRKRKKVSPEGLRGVYRFAAPGHYE